ncbi:MAG TPA: carbohydrate binding domain-containing protein [Bacteroidota bacterium]|nr:carbohydrate binding domain-containing protein [Bacteroidota bacterium]
MIWHIRSRAAAGLLLTACALARAQNFTGGYPFAFPATDTSTQTFLPSFPIVPIRAQDFVSVDAGGHFSLRGSPVRFFGANCPADGAFPTSSKTWFIAGRLRKMGFNLVRLHLMDNPWSANSLFVQGSDTRHLNAATLDRLENFISQLKANGIFVDVNLHVARTFRTADGVAGADSLPQFAKGVTYFDSQLIALQKEYAQQLLTHVNPYTGLAMAEDPVVAMVEVTNENSLFRFWRDGLLRPFAAGGELMVRHSRMLDSLWILYLGGRYGTTESLRGSWGSGASSVDTTSMLKNGSYEAGTTGWFLEVHSPAAGTASLDSASVGEGRYSARIDVAPGDGTDWHIQWKQTALAMQKDSSYSVRFLARADSVRTISLALEKESSPWTYYNGTEITLTPAWTSYTFVFTAAGTETNDLRLSFGIGAAAGSYWFDGVRFARTARVGLLPSESLEAQNVRRIEYAECAGFSDARVSDMTAFYLMLQNAYFDTMRTYLHSALQVRVPVVGTNWNIGLPDVASQSRMDYMDNHAYWDHPQFPGVPWSSTDWFITNQPMVQASAGGTIGPLTRAVAVQGKPFTASEYNHIFPNRYQTEGMVFISAYGSFHDADAIMLYDYGESSDDWESDKIPSYFGISRNSAMISLAPACARAYRSGMIRPSIAPILLSFSPSDVLLSPRHDDGSWAGLAASTRLATLRHAVRISTFAAPSSVDLTSLENVPANPYLTDTGEILWDTGGILTVATPQFASACGMLQSFPSRKIGDLTILSADAFAAVTWVSLTGEPLSSCRRSHLCVSTAADNTGMLWDGTTTLHDQWGSTPTLLRPERIVARLHIHADSIHLWSLGPLGAQGGSPAVYLPSDTNTFNVLLDQNVDHTPWYGIEAFGGGSTSSLPGTSPREAAIYDLRQNYPNPFNPSTTLSYTLARESKVSVRIYDVLGREVAVLVDAKEAAGAHTARWDASLKASGVYICRLRALGLGGSENFERNMKMLLIR